MDLSAIEGLDLSDEQKAAIEAQAKADTEAEVLGLKSKNDELIAEKRAAAEARTQAEAKALAAEEEKNLEAARKANDLAALEETLKGQHKTALDAALAEAEGLKGQITNNKRDAIINEVAAQFNAPESAKLVLRNMINVTLTDTGTATEFKGFDGATVATDSKTFLTWAAQNNELASMMKPIDSTGGGAGGNNGKGGAGAKQVNQAAETAKSKGDLNGFLAASIKL